MDDKANAAMLTFNSFYSDVKELPLKPYTEFG